MSKYVAFRHIVVDSQCMANNYTLEQRKRGQDSKLKLLIAQANPVCRRLLEELLTCWALPFDSVSDGGTTLSHFVDYPYDLVLVDLRMPEIDGFEVVEQIRNFEKEHRTYHIPVIAVTADVHSATAQKCKEVGIWEVVTKPYDHHQLRMIIYYYLGNVWKMCSIQEQKK